MMLDPWKCKAWGAILKSCIFAVKNISVQSENEQLKLKLNFGVFATWSDKYDGYFLQQ